MTARITAEPWGRTPGGADVTLYTLRGAGLTARVMTYGAVLVGLDVPDRRGQEADVVLGHDRLEPYLDRATSPYFGAAIGRYGNRIARGQFELGGVTYQLATNNGPNALHGGPGGFDQQPWSAEPHDTPAGPALRLTRRSPGGEEGYPGALDVAVTYTLTDTALQLDYEARTDAPTVINLTNHSYWNLGGGRQDIHDHRLQVAAGRYTPTDETQIPTGELADVTGTPFDLREARRLGDVLARPDAQLALAGGFDHNLVLDGTGMRQVAELTHPESGRRMTVHTDQPGLQVYSGNFLDGTIRGKGGQVYGHRWALCLETQHYPDSPNRPQFPSTHLDVGQTYQTRTVYQFSAP